MRLSKAEARYLRSLQQKKIRDREKKFVLEGWRALAEALDAPAVIEYVAVAPVRRAWADASVVGELRRRNVPLKEADDALLARAASTVHSQGVLALVAQRTFAAADLLGGEGSLLVAADAVSDPGNVGTLLRTCDWFGADAVLLGRGSVELHNEKVVRSSVGSLLRVRVAEEVDLAAALGEARRRGFTVVAATADAPSSYLLAPYGVRNILVLGGEARGL